LLAREINQRLPKALTEDEPVSETEIATEPNAIQERSSYDGRTYTKDGSTYFIASLSNSERGVYRLNKNENIPEKIIDLADKVAWETNQIGIWEGWIYFYSNDDLQDDIIIYRSQLDGTNKEPAFTIERHFKADGVTAMFEGLDGFTVADNRAWFISNYSEAKNGPNVQYYWLYSTEINGGKATLVGEEDTLLGDPNYLVSSFFIADNHIYFSGCSWEYDPDYSDSEPYYGEMGLWQSDLDGNNADAYFGGWYYNICFVKNGYIYYSSPFFEAPDKLTEKLWRDSVVFGEQKSEEIISSESFFKRGYANSSYYMLLEIISIIQMTGV